MVTFGISRVKVALWLTSLFHFSLDSPSFPCSKEFCEVNRLKAGLSLPVEILKIT